MLSSLLLRLSLGVLALAATLPAQQQSSCGAAPPGKNFAGQTLTRQNYSHQDLTGANFEGATLTAASFVGTNLTNASFKNAIITNDRSNPVLVTDFSMANLTGTCFQSTKFTGTTYFTYSTLTCTDFSETDISTNTVFGPSPLQFDHSTNTCRPAFRSVTMSCEFVNDWQALNLSNAVITPCFPQMKKGNFAGAQMAGVNFTGADLEGADFSSAQLQGATLDRANLTGANLNGALLSNDTLGKVDSAATAVQAHLKNVNLSYATLSGVDFSYANFYSTTPAGQNTCTTTKDNYQGFTKNCASAHGATMTDTKLTDAYLFGVDFTDATMRGVDFSRAILIGANLGATLGTDPNSGTRTSLFRSFLQGANLGSATLSNAVTASGAFVDFRASGNIVYVYLNGLNHNQFACQGASCNPPTGADVCVETYYLQPTTVPATNLTPCPDGSTNPNGCGNPDASGDWQSPLLKSATSIVPLFWYDNPGKSPPTFLPGWQNSQSGRVIERCNGLASTFGW